jgi:hypothetical protein
VLRLGGSPPFHLKKPGLDAAAKILEILFAFLKAAKDNYKHAVKKAKSFSGRCSNDCGSYS